MIIPDKNTHEYLEFLPPPRLANCVKFFYYFQCANDHSERVLPFGSTEITIKLNNDIDVMVKNSITEPYFIRPSALGQMVGICFHPWGFNYLFGIPASEIRDNK